MLKILKYLFEKEVPILMYHRLIKNADEKKIHTIYLDINEFEKQLKYL